MDPSTALPVSFLFSNTLMQPVHFPPTPTPGARENGEQCLYLCIFWSSVFILVYYYQNIFLEKKDLHLTKCCLWWKEKVIVTQHYAKAENIWKLIMFQEMTTVAALIISLPMVGYHRINIVLRNLKPDLINFLQMVSVLSFKQKKSCFWEIMYHFKRPMMCCFIVELMC